MPCAASPLQEGHELLDNAVHKLRKLGEKWQNRLTLDNLRISERYLKGDIEILIQLFDHAPAGLANYCVVFNSLQRVIEPQSSGLWSERRAGEEGQDRLRVQVSNHKQELVLVGNVQLMEFPQVAVASLVRLNSFQETFRTRAHSLYLSRNAGFVFGRSLEDREASPARATTGILPISLDQLPSQMVKSASQVVKDVAHNQRELIGGRVNPELVDMLLSLRVYLSDKSMRVGFSESFNQALEISDVMFGPFDFSPDAA
jgi:hypothetical protein